MFLLHLTFPLLDILCVIMYVCDSAGQEEDVVHVHLELPQGFWSVE